MTEKEVIDRIYIHGNTMTEDEAEVIISALKKQIPKKCNKFVDTCECSHKVYPHMAYCDKCGKKLEWV